MGRYLKLQQETNFGEDFTTVSWAVFIDAMEENFRAENDLQIPPSISQVNRRDTPGRFVGDNGGFGVPIDARTIGLMLHALFGNSTKKTAPAGGLPDGVTEHIFWGASNIPSYRAAVGLDNFMEKRIHGIVFNQGTFGGAAGENISGDYATPFSLHKKGNYGADPVVWGISSQSDKILLGFHEAELYLWEDEGQDPTSNTWSPTDGDNRKPVSYEIVINRNVQMNYVYGQRHAYNYRAQGREVTGNNEVIFENDPAGSDYLAEDEYEKFYGAPDAVAPQDRINGTTIALIGQSAWDITTDSPYRLIFYVPKAKYRTGDVNISGPGQLTQPIAWTAFEPDVAPATLPWDATTHAGQPSLFDVCAILQNDYESLYSAL